MKARTIFGAGLVAIAALGLTGCGDDRQVIVYEQGKYQGKPDTKPYDNAPPAWSSAQWDKGNRDSWEAQLRKRQQGQNEYVRIGDGG